MSKETLLQRLRQYEGAQWETTACYNGLRDEAADEINRLCEALEKIAELNWLDDPQEARRIAKVATAKKTGQ